MRQITATYLTSQKTLFVTKQVDKTITLQICIQHAPSSNLSCSTGNAGWG